MLGVLTRLSLHHLQKGLLFELNVIGDTSHYNQVSRRRCMRRKETEFYQ